MSQNGEDEVNTELLAKILGEVKASREYKPERIEDMFAMLVAEINKHSEGTIATSGVTTLFMEVRPALDKLVFGILDGGSLHPIWQASVKKPIKMGKYKLGVFLVPEKE